MKTLNEISYKFSKISHRSSTQPKIQPVLINFENLDLVSPKTDQTFDT